MAFWLWFWRISVAVGGWKVLQLLRTLVSALYNRTQYQWSELGPWAVVTGGTDGIGKAYVHELASRGFNVCIISRNRQKLQAVAEEVETKYQVSVSTVYIDFTQDRDIYDAIKYRLNELGGDIGVLVNNVGMSYKHTEYFHVLQPQVLKNMIACNVTACTMMLQLVLPQMAERRKGVIINVSSLTAIYPMPLLTVYAACKAYVDYLSRAIHYEYKDRGIFVQSLLPGYVATKMSHRRTRLEVPSPEAFVSSAMKTIGFESYSYGYLPHKIRGFVHEWLKGNMPASVNLAIAMYYMKRGRESYFKKLQKRMSDMSSDTE